MESEASGGTGMQSISWAPGHTDALREYLAKGMSYSEIAGAINAKFGTAFSRNAAIGRARRMGLAAPARPELPGHWPKPCLLYTSDAADE